MDVLESLESKIIELEVELEKDYDYISGVQDGIVIAIKMIKSKEV